MRHAIHAAVAIVLLSTAPPAGAETVPFSSPRWDTDHRDAEIVSHLGRESLHLKAGLTWLRDVDFTDGTLEFDVSLTGERGFLGAVWRLQDKENFEQFYIRPHQSGNPDANQYTPVFNGLAGWQLYHGEGYAATVKYDPGAWIHVKIVVSGEQAEVYIDSTEPVLFIPELKRENKPGRIGLSAVGGFASGWFSNFSYEAARSPALKGGAMRPPDPPAGMIPTWRVSGAFDGSSLAGKTRLTADEKGGRSWTRLPSERSGVANLARVQAPGPGKDTVFARVTLRASSGTAQKISFGYSDRVMVYLNDRLIYSGTNAYRSRDYRYLGTIGLFDDLYLPLEEGDNELWFAVGESFGGWGILARIEARDGVQILD
jgi:hypothetical protein